MNENNNNSKHASDCQCMSCIEKRLDKLIDTEHHERVPYRKKHLECCGNCCMNNKLMVCELYNKKVSAYYKCKNWFQDNLSRSEREKYGRNERESQ